MGTSERGAPELDRITSDTQTVVADSKQLPIYSKVEDHGADAIAGRLTLAVKKILLGQVWRKDDTNETYLVTKLYNEVFATYAVLRKTKGEGVLRVKVEKTGDQALLPGFTYTQEAQDF